MVFLQPVVMNDAHAADRSPAAEVRVVDRGALEQPVWQGWQAGTGPVLAQQGMDQRSPFGNNAPTSNQLTPTPRMVNPNATDNSGQVADPMSTTKIPPAQGQPDAGPPPPSSATSAPPGEPSSTTTGPVPGTTAPGTAGAPTPLRTTPMPNTTPATPTPSLTPGSGAGATPPTIPDTQSVPPQPTAQPSSSTFPGASSGTSNTQ